MIETVEQLEEFFRALAPRVEQALEQALPAGPGGVEVLNGGMRHGAGVGEGASGKRVRPLLCLMTAQALGGTIEEALPFAVAMELMHSFALVHDDIEDGDEWRRGKPAVWKEYGLAQGINVGDGLLARAFAVIGRSGLSADVRAELCLLLAETLESTIEGQALDIEARNSGSITLDQYMDLVTRKTGRYLAAPLVGGALTAGATAGMLRGLSALGPLLGPLFQILDDVIDLSDGKGREAAGNDIREGKRSYLAAHTLSHGRMEDRARLLEILDKPRDLTSEGEVAEAVGIYERSGAFEAARGEAERLRTEAREQIAELESAALSRALAVVMDYLAGRKS